MLINKSYEREIVKKHKEKKNRGNKNRGKKMVQSDIFKGFEVFDNHQGIPKVSIGSNGMSIGRWVKVKLNNPKYISIMFNKSTKQMLIVGTTEKGRNSIAFNNNQSNLRINNQALKNEITEMTSWALNEHLYTVVGKLVDKNTMLFNFDKYNCQ